jgi:hypothetical protein
MWHWLAQHLEVSFFLSILTLLINLIHFYYTVFDIIKDIYEKEKAKDPHTQLPNEVGSSKIEIRNETDIQSDKTKQEIDEGKDPKPEKSEVPTPKVPETEVALPNKTSLCSSNGRIFISYLTHDAGALAGMIISYFYSHRLITNFLVFSLIGFLAEKLRQLGKDVFYAQESLLSGCVYPDELNRELFERDIFVPLVTKDYGTHNNNRSKWCLSELTMAFNQNKKIKPIIMLNPNTHSYPPKHIALQLGIFQAIHWLPLKECKEEVGDDYSMIGDTWPKKCLDIIARIVAATD